MQYLNWYLLGARLLAIMPFISTVEKEFVYLLFVLNHQKKAKTSRQVCIGFHSLEEFLDSEYLGL